MSTTIEVIGITEHTASGTFLKMPKGSAIMVNGVKIGYMQLVKQKITSEDIHTTLVVKCAANTIFIYDKIIKGINIQGKKAREITRLKAVKKNMKSKL